MKIKAVDIASKLHVSKAAVSLALNDKPGNSDGLKRQILECRDEMERAQKHNNIVRMVVFSMDGEKDLRNPFMEKLLAGAGKKLECNGFSLEYVPCMDTPEAFEEIAEQCNQEHTAGLFIHNYSNRRADSEEFLEIYKSLQMPYILYDCDLPVFRCDQVRAGNRQAVMMAYQFLINRGYRNIGYITGNSLKDYNLRKRREAAEQIQSADNIGNLEIISVENKMQDRNRPACAEKHGL